jgi:hypothetical protein
VTKPEVDLLMTHYRVSSQKVDSVALMADGEKVGMRQAVVPEETQTAEELLGQFKGALQDRGVSRRTYS